MMHRPIPILLLAGLAAFLLPATAPHSDGPKPVVPANTLTGVTGIIIAVDSLSRAVEESGVTTTVLAVEIERVLREAGITVVDSSLTVPPPGSAVLHLAVTTLLDRYVDHVTYAIRLELKQAVRLERDPELPPILVPTWSIDGIGYFGSGWRRALVEDVAAFTSDFARAYAAANPSAGG